MYERSSFARIDGRALHFVTAGQGAPTVVFESGTGLDVRLWRRVLPDVAKEARVVAYDRAGVGRSRPAPGERVSLQALAEDLGALLAAIKAPAPFVLVGHSLGGCLVRLFSALQPELIAGLVLVDPMHEGTDPTEHHWQMLCNWEGFSGPWSNFTAPMRAFSSGTSPYMTLPPVPAVVLSCEWSESSARTDREWARAFARSHVDLAASMPRGEYRLVEQSSHFIPRDRPEAVVDAVRAVLQQARASPQPAR